MLIFKITKTKGPTPKGSRPYFKSSAPDIRMQLRQWLVLWNKAKPMLLTYREETKQPWRPIAGLPAAWVLSRAGNLIRFLHGSFLPCLIVTPCLHQMRVAWQNTIELIIISDAVYTGCGAARHGAAQHDKSPTVNCFCVLFIMYWPEHVSGAERWEFPLPAHVGVRSPAPSYTRPLRSIPLPAHLQFHPAPVKSLHARSNLKFLCMPNTCRFQPKPYAWDTLSAWRTWSGFVA